MAKEETVAASSERKLLPMWRASPVGQLPSAVCWAASQVAWRSMTAWSTSITLFMSSRIRMPMAVRILLPGSELPHQLKPPVGDS